jgi:segregation and condensation protein B
MSLENKIEGVLFYKATPLKKANLAKIFDCTVEEINNALERLKTQLDGSALCLIDTGTDVELVTIASLDETIEQLRKDELRRDIGKAGAETLAIILYKGPVNRAQIDRIRGVNSSFILRNLLVRGLIEKDSTAKNIEYRITTQLLSHLGIKEKTQVPEFANIMNALEAYEIASNEID